MTVVWLRRHCQKPLAKWLVAWRETFNATSGPEADWDRAETTSPSTVRGSIWGHGGVRCPGCDLQDETDELLIGGFSEVRGSRHSVTKRLLSEAPVFCVGFLEAVNRLQFFLYPTSIIWNLSALKSRFSALRRVLLQCRLRTFFAARRECRALPAFAIKIK